MTIFLSEYTDDKIFCIVIIKRDNHNNFNNILNASSMNVIILSQNILFHNYTFGFVVHHE